MGKHEAERRGFRRKPRISRIDREREEATEPQEREEATEPQEREAGFGKTAAIVLVVVAVLLVAVTVAFVIFWQRTSSVTNDMFKTQKSQVDIALSAAVTPTPEPQKLALEEVSADFVDSDGNAWNFRDDLVTVLVMGIDYMGDADHYDENAVNHGNADLVALAILDPVDVELSLLYIPRDTMVDIVELTSGGDFLRMAYDNLCIAHEFGDGGGLSCEIVVRAVSDLLAGAPIDRYVAVDYDAIYEIDELIGGVTVTMDGDYTEFDSDFYEGATVTLTGEQLKTFVTDRSEIGLDSAFNRGHRQMLFLNSVFQQCKEETEKNLSFPVRLFNQALDYITTNLSVNEVTTLARLVFQTGFDAENVITLEGELGMNGEYAGYYPDEEWIEQFVVEYLCESAE